MSDFRQIGGLGYLFGNERVVVLSVIFLSTPLLGSSAWFIKLIIAQGNPIFCTNVFASGVLSLTWFFGSIYLLYFYKQLFLGNHQFSLNTRIGSWSKTPTMKLNQLVYYQQSLEVVSTKAFLSTPSSLILPALSLAVVIMLGCVDISNIMFVCNI